MPSGAQDLRAAGRTYPVADPPREPVHGRSSTTPPRPHLVSADDLRVHLVMLRRRDVAEATIAGTTGVPLDLIQGILQRRIRWVSTRLARALLELEPPAPLVDVAGTSRRLRWLAALGWNTTELESRCGIPHETLSTWAQGAVREVPAAEAAAVTAVYDDLYAEDGPCTETRRAAERRGWHKQVWLDEDIDDPNAAPLNGRTLVDEVAVDRVLSGDRQLAPDLTRRETEEVVRLGTRSGASQKDLAELLDTSSRQICRVRARIRDAQPAAAAPEPAPAAERVEPAEVTTPRAGEPCVARSGRPLASIPAGPRRPRARRGGTRRPRAERRRRRSRARPGQQWFTIFGGGIGMGAARPKGLTSSSIEWLRDPATGLPGFSWNFVDGCEHASPGCDFCYAEAIATRFAGAPAFPHGFALTLREDRLDAPLRRRTPARIFVNSMSDLGLSEIPVELLVRAFAVMARCPRHTFLILTKRPTVLRSRLSKPDFVAAVRALVAAEPGQAEVVWPLPNVHVGVSVEDQAHAWRVLELLRLPAAVRWVSAEPLIGPLDLRNIAAPRAGTVVDALAGDVKTSTGEVVGASESALRWVVVGGESGSAGGIRPMHPQWEQDLRRDCTAVGVAYFFKQWGAYAPHGQGEPTSAGRHGPVTLVAPDGTRHRSEPGALAPAGSLLMSRYGKRRAGRQVDGATYDAYPLVTTADGGR